MFCPECGAKIADDSRFRKECGKNLVLRGATKPGIVEVCEIRDNHDIPGWLSLSMLCHTTTVNAWYEAILAGTTIARSREFSMIVDRDGYPTSKATREEKAAQKELIDDLQRDGWEPIISQDGGICSMKRTKR